MGNSSKRHNHFKLIQRQDRCREKGAAIADFSSCGFVLRGHAAHGIGDQARHEAQAVPARCLIRAGCKAKINQSFVKKLARKIASKRPAGAICAAEARRQANDQEARIVRTKRRNGGVVPLRLNCPKRITKL
jgi:hypothetical protein